MKKKLLIFTIVLFIGWNYLYSQNYTEKKETKKQEILNNGVEINGIIWATGNLDNGKFVDPEEYGRLYDWESANDACPEGWRLPTKEEFISLCDAPNRWTTTPISGRIFGSGNHTIFLPAAGLNASSGSNRIYMETSGFYHSSSTNSKGTWTFNLRFFKDEVNPTNSGDRAKGNGLSVRCVAE
jgi:uncharacterized protein (TIGR02145 family)